MTLRQSWEEVYSCSNVDYNEEHGEVEVDVEVESELVKLEGQVIRKETEVWMKMGLCGSRLQARR